MAEYFSSRVRYSVLVENVTNPDEPGWRRPAPTREQKQVDALSAAGLFLASVLSMALWKMTGIVKTDAPDWLSVIALAVSTLPLAARRIAPIPVAIVVNLGFTLAAWMPVPESFIIIIALFLALYTVGAWEANRNRAALAVGILAVAQIISLLASLFMMATKSDLKDKLAENAVGFALSPLVAYFLINFLINLLYYVGAIWFGWNSWNFAANQARLLQASHDLAKEQRHLEEQAITIERIRIARELHDSVAHHLAVMGVQAGAARLSGDQDISTAALGQIEESSRSAVAELQDILHTLRAPADSDQREAIASLGVDRLPELMAEAKNAGLNVLYESPEIPALPPLVSLTIYRVTQESLTNVVRHAGPGTQASIRIRLGKEWVELEVFNKKPPNRVKPFKTGAHLGLIGMRERVEAVGGKFEAGPLSRGGFVTRARLPLKAEA